MATDKKEKLQKILEQIERENAVIAKAKDNIKRLKLLLWLSEIKNLDDSSSVSASEMYHYTVTIF